MSGPWLGRLAALPVRGYRRWLSGLKPPMCRFHPTCSAYAIEALELHGLLRGGRLATWRILRCQPFCRGGFDPVPDSPLARAGSACDSACDVQTPPSGPAARNDAERVATRTPR